jgi:hypothetical protein
MFRLLLGVIAGIFISYYTLPVIESHIGSLPRPDIVDLLHSSNKKQSNTINALSPDDLKQLSIINLKNEVITAASTVQSQAIDADASHHTTTIIRRLLTIDSSMHPFVEARLSNGITNGEALEIFVEYLVVSRGRE